MQFPSLSEEHTSRPAADVLDTISIACVIEHSLAACAFARDAATNESARKGYKHASKDESGKTKRHADRWLAERASKRGEWTVREEKE